MLGILVNFRDFFRILVSRRSSLSYQERHVNIIFRFFVFSGLSFIFLIVGACVLVFYNGSSKFIFDLVLIIFCMVFSGVSSMYRHDICNESDFGGYLSKIDKIMTVVDVLSFLFFIFILWKLGLLEHHEV